MEPAAIAQLSHQYQQLRAQLDRRQISPEHFYQAVSQLQAMDEQGVWWTVDPSSGAFLKYVGDQWVMAGPAPAASRPLPVPRATPARGGSCCLTSPLMVGLMSFGAAGLWLVYSSLRASEEGFDLLTPLLIGGLPLAMRLLQRPIDRLLSPLFSALNVFPRPLLTGAAFSLPLVCGLLSSAQSDSGYGALRLTALFGVIGGYLLTRRSQAA
ncbi:MAG TPA: hypothetical protein VJ123_03570 [Anaerolineales bacterium]|nr:hypothetical protein [Anaerolineales bacterium]